MAKFYGIVIKRKDMTIPPTKEEEKIGKENVNGFLPDAFTEAEEMIDRARKRKGY